MVFLRKLQKTALGSYFEEIVDREQNKLLINLWIMGENIMSA